MESTGEVDVSAKLTAPGDSVNDMLKASSNIKTLMVESKRDSQRAIQRRHLVAIVAIEDGKSVHRAAAALELAQPAVSRLLSEAEQLLGGRLFERSSRGSRPTLFGERILPQARAVLRGFERMDVSPQRERGPVSLGCIARAMHTLLPALLTRVSQDAEPGRLRVVEESSAYLWDAVSRGMLDFAILRKRGDSTGDDDIVAEPLYDERTVIVCGADADGPGRSPLSLDDLMRHRWVLPDARTSSREAFDRYCSDGGLPPVQPVIETRAFETGLALAARTGLLSIAPESIARQHASSGMVRVLRTRVPLPTSPTLLAFKRWAIEDPVVARWHAHIHDAGTSVRKALKSR
ncbi:LysR family transcriptional regulator [Variovorax sp. PBL-H6]|uniref:LysR family transcriptional regulator n=1 Tax=Variovorax sp. PBL-H6 TaxID=434009 RepID=UPI0013A5A336|nr:LysR family transcriptional regulator [Variovorax sp. PBL-H6]